jgi:hypothetical protein
MLSSGFDICLVSILRVASLKVLNELVFLSSEYFDSFYMKHDVM